jgi:hypothetical protein
MVFFAGDVVQDDLLKLAEAVGEPLYRGLAATESASARRRSQTSAVEDLYALDLGIGSRIQSAWRLEERHRLGDRLW